jgi:pimeloyl-ACP methyl ester carboxylesterase
MLNPYFRVIITVIVTFSTLPTAQAQESTEAQIIRQLQQDQPYHTVSPQQFEQLGWELPDGGTTVKTLADAAPDSAFDPRDLEKLPAEKLGYKAKWHEVRYNVYGLDWDIPGLHLIPNEPIPGMPTMVIINGGASNWYEFFVDPLNRPGIGQYLAQKIPVMLVTIPGNYRHGGWADDNYGQRIPGYLLDRDISDDEFGIRNAIYTFRVVTDGIKKLLETTTTGPLVIIGHSTGGEVQFLLHDSGLKDRLQGLSMGWGTGGPAGLDVMKQFRGPRTADSYPDVWEIRPRPAEGYSRGYLGPLNPVWDPNKSRVAVAEHWQGLEKRRKPQFKQPLQDIEHQSSDNLYDHISSQIQQTLAANEFGINPDEVIADLFTTMRSSHTGYRKMIWTTSRLDDGHWNDDISEARELLIANEFREKNPATPIRVMVFDVPITHYGHIEKPRELAGGLLVALKWLVEP